VTTVIEIMISFFDSLICIYFIMRFNRSKWFENPSTIIALFVLFFATVAGDKFLPGFSIISTLILFAITIVYAVIICKGHYIKAILSACIYKIAYILLSSLLYMVISSIISDFDSLMQGSSEFTRYIYVLLHKILLIAILQIFTNLFNAESLSDVKTGILTFLISIVTVVGLGASMTIISATNGETYKTQIIVLICSYIAVNIGLYVLVSQVQKLQKNKYELKLLYEKMNFHEEKYEESLAVWTNVRKMQHDMKQHLIVMRGQLTDGDIEGCRNYINNLIPKVEHIGRQVRTDNPILDYLLNSKLHASDEVEISVMGTVPDLSDISDADLTCLMGNIFDNAIEAVTGLEKKRIDLLFTQQNSNRIIICMNTISESVLAKGKNLVSTKSDYGNHGYGHLIVEKIVSDHNGIIDYFEEQGMFGVQIVLPVK